MKLPDHVYLSLHHNEHRSTYETIQHFEDFFGDNPFFDWVSDEQRDLAYETQDFWYCQWYPDTPQSFHCLAAHDLDVLLGRVNGA